MRARLATVAAIGALVLLAAPEAMADAAFDDPAADQQNTVDLVAPDITGVQVTNTRGGVMTFRITIGNYASLPPSSRIALLFDLDKSLATGDQGFERAVRHDIDAAGQTKLVLERFDEGTVRLVEIPATNLTSGYSSGVFTLTIPRGELENTISFEFGMYAALLDTDGDDHAVDSAPNTELWTYDLSGLAAPRLSTTRLTRVPSQPVAGRAFTVATLVRRSDTGGSVTSGTVTCAVRIGQARARSTGGFSGGRARCVISVPRNAKGKILRGTMTVRAAGARLTRTFSYRVG
jgi:hypothetical protein